MKVRVYQAVLVVEERETKLTKAVARQFPFAPFSKRFDMAVAGEKAPVPIGKVMGSAFDKDRADTWLLLVEDEVSGLEWQYPVFEPPEHRRGLVVWYDDLAAIPTIVL